MLAVSAQPFDHPDYIFEVKWDGYRCLAYLEKGGTTLLSRNLKELNRHFPDLADLQRMVADTQVILDGEIVVLRDGRPSFSALQARSRLTGAERVRHAARQTPALFIAFDILHRRHQSLMDWPLQERAAQLREVVKPGGCIVVSEGIPARGVDFYHACVAKGLEGVMAKRLDSRYHPGTRSPAWKKIRATREADLVICGYRAGKGGRLLGALVLGAWNGKRFVYQGMVGTGIDQQEETELLEKLAALAAPGTVFDDAATAFRAVRWVKPELVCRVEYLALTGHGLLRHPVFRGLREDKAPRACGPVNEQNPLVAEP